MYEVSITYMSGTTEVVAFKTFQQVQLFAAGIKRLVETIDIKSIEPEESIPDLEYPQ